MADRQAYAAIVFGAGGIGRALTERLLENPRISRVWSVSRRSSTIHDPKLVTRQLDPADESALSKLAAEIQSSGQVLRLALVTTGVLKDDVASPEKSWKALDPRVLAHTFAINTILPALIAKHILPLLPRQERSVFAALSARVGSISDNRLGGWYAYRASKAALNQIIHTLAIELARTHPQALCVALHPGTVDTPLSASILGAGAAATKLSPRAAAEALLNVLAGLEAKDSGGFFGWDGQAIPF